MIRVDGSHGDAEDLADKHPASLIGRHLRIMRHEANPTGACAIICQTRNKRLPRNCDKTHVTHVTHREAVDCLTVAGSVIGHRCFYISIIRLNYSILYKGTLREETSVVCKSFTYVYRQRNNEKHPFSLMKICS